LDRTSAHSIWLVGSRSVNFARFVDRCSPASSL
jgi:hypothetical protein